MKIFPKASDYKRVLFSGLCAFILGIALSSCLGSFYFRVVGPSMEPTIHDGARVLLLWTRSEPIRGSVVTVTVFDPDEQQTEYWIKRVIGLPGETVTIRSGEFPVQINGKDLEEPYLNGAKFFYYQSKSWTCGPDEYFIMGDNRELSKDSRVIGPIKKTQIRKVLDVWFTTLGRQGIWISK